MKNDGNLAEAGRQLGLSRQAVRQRIERHPEIKSVMAKALDRAGATDRRLAEKLTEQLEATRMISGGADNPPIETPDNQAQLKAVELCLKVKGHIQTGGDVNVDNSKKIVQLFADVKDSDLDQMDTVGLINGLSGRLGQQRTSK